MSARPLVGIDLGTTYSLISVFEEGEVRLIPNAHGSVLTPSVVGLVESGEVVVGAPARSLAITHPERVSAAFKRWMGEDRAVTLGGQRFSPEELSSLVLRSLRADAEAALGVAVESAVVTVPAYFNQPQRDATRRAAELAGLRVDRILNEPTAAALTYGMHRVDRDQRLVVLDLGGGTFDVTVMEIFDRTLEIQSTAGESRLGGEDFTDRLVGAILREQGLALEQLEVHEPLRVARLREEAERAKRELSSADEAFVRLPDASGSVEGDSTRVRVTRESFRKLAEPLLERIRRPVLRALRDARLEAGAVDAVLLVGGATRMPVVHELATELFGRSPRASVDPDRAVAIGAAIQAALVADHAAVDDMVMTDVCPHTLGIEISKEFGRDLEDGYYLPILHRNSTIPMSRAETVHTLHDDQRELRIRVFQGESRRVEDNLLLGELVVEDLPRRPRGLAVSVRFTYDLNGLLEVEAWIPSTGTKTRTVLKNLARELSVAETRDAVRRMQELKFCPREDLENVRLLRFAEAAYGEVDTWRREELGEAIDAFERQLHEEDRDGFAAARERLLQLLSLLGTPFPTEESDG